MNFDKRCAQFEEQNENKKHILEVFSYLENMQCHGDNSKTKSKQVSIP